MASVLWLGLSFSSDSLGIQREIFMPTKLLENLNQMLRNFKEENLNKIMIHVGYLGNVGVVFAGVVGLIKYRADIFPCCPNIGLAAGILGVFITFILLVAIAFGVWKSVHSMIKNQLVGHLIGIVCSGFIVLLGLGAIFLASNA